MAAMYAVYHGPEGLKEIAQRVHGLAAVFAAAIKASGVAEVPVSSFFDTVKVSVGPGKAQAVAEAASAAGSNIRVLDDATVREKGDDCCTGLKQPMVGMPITGSTNVNPHSSRHVYCVRRRD